MNYTVLSFFGTQLCRFTTSSVPTLSALQQQITTSFSIAQPVQLLWVDQNGDISALRTDADVSVAFTTPFVKIYTQVVQTVIANTNSPITTISDNPITTVPITTTSS